MPFRDKREVEEREPTHKERLTKLLDDMGVAYNTPVSWLSPLDENAVRFMEGDDKVTGYCGFFVQFEFHSNGSLREVVILE
jgi:hypothetical protein